LRNRDGNTGTRNDGHGAPRAAVKEKTRHRKAPGLCCTEK
jgi:hypothetical protein